VSLDILFSGTMEAYMSKATAVTADVINPLDPFSLWEAYRHSGALKVASFVSV
jgi:hypothetical protein